MQYNTIQCNTIQCNAIQCNTIQYNTQGAGINTNTNVITGFGFDDNCDIMMWIGEQEWHLGNYQGAIHWYERVLKIGKQKENIHKHIHAYMHTCMNININIFAIISINTKVTS